jgi:hypothetical protein
MITSFVMALCDLGPPLWSSGRSSWLQTQRSGFDSRLYQIFREVVGLERGTLSLVIIMEEIKVVTTVQKTEITVVRIRHADHLHPLSVKVGTALISGGRSLGIVRSRTRVTEFLCDLVYPDFLILKNGSSFVRSPCSM